MRLFLDELSAAVEPLGEQVDVESFGTLAVELVHADEPFSEGRPPEVEGRAGLRFSEGLSVKVGVDSEEEGKLLLG